MTQSTPIFSIIVPSYNKGLFIAETLQSVIDQTFVDWECLVVDDGSSDDSVAIANQFAQKDQRIRVYVQQNSGVSRARNYAISLSKGTLILPLDADDLIAPEYLAEAYKVFEKDQAIKLVYCKAEKFGDENCKWQLPQYSYFELLFENSIFCSAIFKKADFLKIDGYNENFKLGYEDWEFWVRFLNPEDKVFQIPREMFLYRIIKTSRNNVLHQNLVNDLKADIYRINIEKYKLLIVRYLEIENKLKKEEISYLQVRSNFFVKILFKLGLVKY